MNKITRAITQVLPRRIDEAGNVIAQSQGTGFFWKSKDNFWYLITNWHVVTGSNPDTGKLLGTFIPNALTFHVLELHLANGKRYGTRLTAAIPLYDREQPIWIEHPLGRWIDIVAIPFSLPSNREWVIQAVNECDEFTASLVPAVSMDSFVVGFPQGLAGPNGTSIWKRASVASEPELNYDSRPIFLVDTATRSGMSGSPVLIKDSGIHMPSGEFGDDSIFGTNMNFAGVYSGRVDDDPMGVQLGRVWKAATLAEVVLHGIPGSNPNDHFVPPQDIMFLPNGVTATRYGWGISSTKPLDIIPQ
ncbi:MAG: trypsin-like peptidase domain-containing protein [Rhizobiales bacterium]|nr:trypsin-like peptidase domain-containing protein [Hyphomicrobiales bacterium]